MTSALPQLTKELLTLARQGREAAAASLIPAFLSAFEAQISRLPHDSQMMMMQLLPKLLRSQEARDWVAYADLLEYEIFPILGQQ